MLIHVGNLYRNTTECFRQYLGGINLNFSLILADLQHGRKFRLDKIITGSEIRNFQLVFVYFSTKCSYCEEQKWKVEHIRDIAGPNTRRGFISKSTIIYYDYFLFLQLHSFYLGSPLVKLCARYNFEPKQRNRFYLSLYFFKTVSCVQIIFFT